MENRAKSEFLAKVETITIEITNRDFDLAKDEAVFNITPGEGELIFEIVNNAGTIRTVSIKIPAGFKPVSTEYIYNEKHEVAGFRVLFGREVKRVTEQD